VRRATPRLLLLTSNLAALALVCGCDRDSGDRRGVPPASAWKPPAAEVSEVEGQAGRASEPDTDPHAGIATGSVDDPHAGLDMGGRAGDPHASLTGDQDPHAGLDLDGVGVPSGDGGVDPAMAGMSPPDPDRPIDPSKFLRGSIRASAEIEAAIKPGAVLFLSAWPVAPATGEVLGSPVAVAKLAVGKFPMPFDLSERDGMVDGTRFDGDVLLTARVDGDGEARTKEPGDVEGRMRARIPASGLDLVLDTALR
jgi:hypothetical protein